MSSAKQKSLDVLLNAQRNGKLHHAILLYGTELAELELVAKTVAAQILKSQAFERHADMFELKPSGAMRQIKIGSDAERVGGEWPANTMRGLLHKLRQGSTMGSGKVAIVFEADRMNVYTANAFLKTLEEPGKDTTIFLLTTRVNDLLDTIRSRCINMRIDCPPSKFEDEGFSAWLDNYSAWIAKLCTGIGKDFGAGKAVLNCYALIDSFDKCLNRLTQESADALVSDPDEELTSANILSMTRRAVCKVLLTQIEQRTVDAALENLGGKLASSKLVRALESLEKASGFTELNMQSAQAFEYFMLSSLKIWTSR